MKNKLQILVLSFDGFSDIWPIFFDSFYKNWIDCPFKINLITNYKKYEDERVNSIKTGEDVSWSYNLMKALVTLETDYVLILYDDAIINKPVNSKKILEFLDICYKLKLNYFRLRNSPDPDIRINEEYGEILRNSYYRTSLFSSIINRKVLLNLLRAEENAWDFEFNGTYRSRNLSGFFATYEYHIPILHAIEKGKWREEAVILAKSFGIDCGKRGYYIPTKSNLKQSLKQKIIFFIPQKYHIRLIYWVRKLKKLLR
ncbi:MAG: hypothetical protein IPO14_05460 [Saprospiraceae bacterium]|jgi:hypothetical protein|nr:hypothetical protein [Saprospiraceae bacterium]